MITISVGGSLLKSIDKFSFNDELDKVDKYLYKAKENGKDACCLNNEII